MTLTADLQSIADVDPGVIAMQIDEYEGSTTDENRGRMRGLARRVVPRGGAVASGLLMSAACVASVLVASALHSGSPWAGVNAVPSGLGLVGRRPPSYFDPRLAAISLGTIAGGSLIMASLVNKLTPARGIGRVGGGVLAGLGSFAMDRFLMRRTLIPALTSSLGPVGTVLKYGAIGVAAILGRRAR